MTILQRSDNFRVEFANHLRMRLTPADIGIVFGFQDQVSPNQVVATETALFVMTPDVAKTLAVALTKTIEIFEATYGVIRTAPPAKGIDQAELVAALSAAIPGLTP